MDGAPSGSFNFNSFFNSLLASRADSTVKKYIKEINKFLLWCRARNKRTACDQPRPKCEKNQGDC